MSSFLLPSFDQASRKMELNVLGDAGRDLLAGRGNHLSTQTRIHSAKTRCGKTPIRVFRRMG